MNINEFISKISELKTVISIRGKHYSIIRASQGYVLFYREEAKAEGKIKISELYDFYKKEKFYNTSIAKKYISGRVQSPSVAILNAITKK